MQTTLNINFGDRVAENESNSLDSYFIKTEHWQKLRSGSVDIIFGSKGAGKSALYTLLVKDENNLEKEGVTVISAEKPTGQTVFSEIKDTPPTGEAEFVTLWKIYICQLIIKKLTDKKLCCGIASEVKDKLVDAGIIYEDRSLKRLINSARQFAKKLINFESLEAGGGIDGVHGKITFRTPSAENKSLGYSSVDELLEDLNEFLTEQKINIWVLFDRLDVAFDQDPELEKNALRALFKTYRDIEDLDAIYLKIFLRDDIWKRITDEGFRESSHITRTTTIFWSPQSLLNLIILRAIKNKEITDKFFVDLEEVQKNHQKQINLYYQIYPRQVDVGEKQSDTFDWILNRVRDGLGNAAPREVIHFHNEIVKCENENIAIGQRKVDGDNIFSRLSIKGATAEVSKVKTEQNLFAENPSLKNYIIKLEGKKAEQNVETLSMVWGTIDEETKKISSELTAIGFFEQRAAKDEGIYKIPFVYRPYLRIIQGKAF